MLKIRTVDFGNQTPPFNCMGALEFEVSDLLDQQLLSERR